MSITWTENSWCLNFIQNAVHACPIDLFIAYASNIKLNAKENSAFLESSSAANKKTASLTSVWRAFPLSSWLSYRGSLRELLICFFMHSIYILFRICLVLRFTLEECPACNNLIFYWNTSRKVKMKSSLQNAKWNS